MSADLQSIAPKRIASFQLPATRHTMQAHTQDPKTGEWYVVQVRPGTVRGAETQIICRLSPSGRFISSMTCVNAGHGGALSVQNIDGDIFLVMGWRVYSGSKLVRQDIVRIKWRGSNGNTTIRRDSSNVTQIGKGLTSGGVITCTLDDKHNRIVIRHKYVNHETYIQYSYTDFKDGEAKVLGKVTVEGTASQVYQGFTFDDDILYRWTGSTSGGDPRTLWAYSLKTGKRVWKRSMQDLGGTSRHREPEAAHVVYDGKVTRLRIGIVVKPSSGGYTFLIYELAGKELTDNTPPPSPDPTEPPPVTPTDPLPDTQFPVMVHWFDFIAGYEASRGIVTWMYFDTHKPPLCTTGIGNMIDTGTQPTADGYALPWRFKNGRLATKEQIKAEYTRLKKAKIVGDGYASKGVAELFVTKDIIEHLVTRKTLSNWDKLNDTFPLADTWPADAQIALMGMAWWMGPAFTAGFPNFTAGLAVGDFFKASANARTIANGPRDDDHQKLFLNAGMVKAAGLSTDILWGVHGTPKVAIGGSWHITLDKLKVSDLVASQVSAFTLTAWYVQRMLAKTGHYTSTIDGKFGPVSNAAYTAFCNSRGIATTKTVTSLSRLTKDSTFFLPVVA